MLFLKEYLNLSYVKSSTMTVISPYAAADLRIVHLTAHHLNIDHPPDGLSEAVLNDDIKQGWITDWDLLLLL